GEGGNDGRQKETTHRFLLWQPPPNAEALGFWGGLANDGEVPLAKTALCGDHTRRAGRRQGRAARHRRKLQDRSRVLRILRPAVSISRRSRICSGLGVATAAGELTRTLRGGGPTGNRHGASHGSSPSRHAETEADFLGFCPCRTPSAEGLDDGS